MPVPTTSNKKQFYGDGVNTVWGFPYPVHDESHLKLVVTSPSGADTWVDPDKYQVNGIEAGLVTVTYPLEGSPVQDGYKVTIVREVPLTQEYDPENGGGWNAEDAVKVDDNAMMAIQQVAEIASRSLTVSIGSGPEVDPNTVLSEIFAARDEAQASAGAAQASEAGAAGSASSAQADAAAAAQSAAEAQAVAEHFWDNVSEVTDKAKGAASAITGPKHIYMSNAAGTAAEWVEPVSSASTPGTIPARDAAGRIKAAAPASADDVARKTETDAAASSWPNYAARVTVTVPTSAARYTMPYKGFIIIEFRLASGSGSAELYIDGVRAGYAYNSGISSGARHSTAVVPVAKGSSVYTTGSIQGFAVCPSKA